MRQQAVPVRNIAAAVIGNALEWYDFLVFAFMTPIIAKLFFPVDPNAASGDLNALLMTTAIFGVGFFMRPVGGIVLGLYGDRYGRKPAMVLVTSLMSVSIAIIALSPTYLAAGLLAPILILIARLLQGFSAGGEFGTATSLLIEMSPRGRRGFYGSWQMTGQMVALLLGAAVGTLITEVFTAAQIEAWAWRLPFIFGLAIVPVAIYIRRNLEETDSFQEMKAERERARQSGVDTRPRVLPVIRAHSRELLIAIGLCVAGTVSVYISFTYLVTYATRILQLPLADAFSAQLLTAVIMVILTPFMGLASDRFGRRTMMLISLVGFLLVLYPLYVWLTAAPSFGRLMVVQIVICPFIAGFYGSISTALAELFPPQIRSTGLSLAYNVGVMVFGGFAQFIVTWLFKVTGSPMAPAWYVMVGVALAVVAAWHFPRQPSADLAEDRHERMPEPVANPH